MKAIWKQHTPIVIGKGKHIIILLTLTANKILMLPGIILKLVP